MFVEDSKLLYLKSMLNQVILFAIIHIYIDILIFSVNIFIVAEMLYRISYLFLHSTLMKSTSKFIYM